MLGRGDRPCHLEGRDIYARADDRHARPQPTACGAVLITVNLKGSWTEVDPGIRDEAVQDCIEPCCRAAVKRVVLRAAAFHAVRAIGNPDI